MVKLISKIAITSLVLVGISATPANADTCTITISDSNSIVNGTAGNDIICLDGSNDTVNALAGNDKVIDTGSDNSVTLGDGNDIFDGTNASGNATVDAGAGTDTVNGTSFADWLTGGAGDDVINANAGNDTIYGGDGNDTINGNGDNDTIYGDAGTDNISGAAGDDQIQGGVGNDSIAGGDGADNLAGGDGNDTVKGEAGADVILGEGGTDTLDGGTGTNVCDSVAKDTIKSCLYDSSKTAGPAAILTLVNPRVDVTSSSQSLYLTIGVKDSIGVSRGYVICSPDVGAGRVNALNLNFRDLSTDTPTVAEAVARSDEERSLIEYTVTGNAKDMTISIEVNIPTTQHGGIYNCDAGFINVVNTRGFNGSDTLNVVSSTGDDLSQGPQLQSFTMSQNTADVSNGAVLVTIKARMTAAEAIQGFGFKCLNPDINPITESQYSLLNIMAGYDGGPTMNTGEPGKTVQITGFDDDITATSTLEIPRGQYAGHYDCLFYNYYLERWLPMDNVSFDVTFNGHYDSESPVVVSAAITPSTFNITSNSKPIPLRADIVVNDASVIIDYTIDCTNPDLNGEMMLPAWGSGYGYLYNTTVSSVPNQEYLTQTLVRRDTAFFNVAPDAGVFNCEIEVVDKFNNRSIFAMPTITVTNNAESYPGPVRNLAVTSFTDKTANLTWDIPSYMGTSSITDYKIFSSANGGAWTAIVKSPAISPNRSISLSKLKASTHYLIKVIAVNAGGESSEQGVDFYTQGIPTYKPAPSGPPTITKTSILIQFAASYMWMDGDASRVTKEKVEMYSPITKKWSILSNAAPVCEFWCVINAQGLAEGRTYSFRITDSNSYGTGPTSNIITWTTKPGTPIAPTGLTAKSITASSAKLSWTTSPATGEFPILGYRIEYKKVSEAIWSTENVTTNSFSLTGLDSATTYQYRIAAKNLREISLPATGSFTTTAG